MRDEERFKRGKTKKKRLVWLLQYVCRYHPDVDVDVKVVPPEYAIGPDLLLRHISFATLHWVQTMTIHAKEE